MGDRRSRVGVERGGRRDRVSRDLHICHQRYLHHQEKSSVSKATGP